MCSHCDSDDCAICKERGFVHYFPHFEVEVCHQCWQKAMKDHSFFDYWDAKFKAKRLYHWKRKRGNLLQELRNVQREIDALQPVHASDEALGIGDS